jgi:hypothetical protein
MGLHIAIIAIQIVNINKFEYRNRTVIPAFGELFNYRFCLL